MSIEKIESSIKELLKNMIRTIPDYPKPGIQFKDITPLLGNKDTLELTSRMLASPYRGKKIDYVAGLESRGFLFGINVAQDLHAGFVPIRKPNKLPSDTISVSYELEYGTDSLEIHKDAIIEGANVIIHDDLIATGGTAFAAYELIEKLGGNVVGFSFVMEIGSLKGKNKLPQSVPYHTVLIV
ncbi:MAG: adenine phosphoribosyltransferase [Balneolaceae bacterium]